MRTIGNGNDVVMVDDNPAEELLARTCYEMAQLSNPWRFYRDPTEFLDYLHRVRDGQEPMPAVVLLDINMPQKSGFEVLEETRSDAYFAALPIFLMLTNSDNPSDKERARALGASGFQVKPQEVDAYIGFLQSLASLPELSP